MNKKIYFLILFFASLTFCLKAQRAQTHSGRYTGQDAFPLETYIELENPTKPNLAEWQKIGNIIYSWGKSNVRYKKEEPFSGKIQKKLNLTAWKGEKVNAQLVISTNVDISKLNFEVSDLRHSRGKYTINKDNISRAFVRYVMTDELNKGGRGACGARPDLSKYDSSLVADPIDDISQYLKVDKHTSQALWLSVKVPQDAVSGNYRAEIIVKDGQSCIGRLKLKLKVLDHVLPSPEEWTFHLDLWQNPFAIARYHKLELWSDEHFLAMKPYMEMYKNAGGKVITTSIMHKPWNGQTYDPFLSMVKWIKKKDSTWVFDYTIFDKWVQFMMDLGIKKEINCYSMVPWKLSFQYFDEQSNSYKEIKTKPSEKAYQEVWGAMLKSFAKHLKEKKWFEITNIAMDERPKEVMLQTFKIIKRADPDFKVSLAGALHPELSDELQDYCVALRMKYSDELKALRKSEGKVTTFYTSCEEPFPNTFTFSSPAESEWLAWYAAKEGLDGYLRWAYNSWVIEPLLDSRFYTWAAGDCFLVYPGPRSSLRFENLVAGIQAYEKIRILRDEFKKQNNTEALDKINKILELFDEHKLASTPASEFVDRANKELNKF